MRPFIRLYIRLYISPLLLLCWVLPQSAIAQCGGSFQVLHYTETTGYDHNTRNQSLAMFQSWATAENYTVTQDNDGSEFNSLANLQQYAVVVFSNTSGNSGLNATQRSNFEAYINAGGSYLGIHAASDTYRHSSANGGSKGTWDWYAETVAGASVRQNPNHTSSNHNNTMSVEVPAHPTMANVPSPWNKTEEYYYWEGGYLNNTFTELLRVGQTGNNSYDAPRQMAHCKELAGGGRTFYTALGHAGSNYTNDQNFKNLMKDALLWCAAPNIQGGSTLALTATTLADSCGKGNGKITLSVGSGSAPFSYNWSSGSTSKDLTGLDAGTYSVTVTDSDGCTGSQSFTVPKVGDEFSIEVELKNSIPCHGDAQGSLGTKLSGGDAPITYAWSQGGTSATVTNLLAGNYSVVALDANGCQATDSFTIDEPDPVTMQLTATPNTQVTGLPNGSVSASVMGGKPPYQYAWEGPDNFQSTQATLSGLKIGVYSLTVKDANNCEETDEIEVTGESNTTSLEEAFGISVLKLYPNPASDQVTLHLESDRFIDFRMELINVQGQIIYQQPVLCDSECKHLIEVASLPAGVYVLRLVSEEASVSRRLLIQD